MKKNNVQIWLNKEYSKHERKEIKKLNISGNNLEGDLDLSDFVNLEELNCSCNELKNIKISKNKKLKWINCSDNLLINIDFSHQDPKIIKGIIIQNNNFSSQNLKIFSHFVNLRYLFVGNDDKKKIKKSIYNRFYGSLQWLKKLKLLTRLNINGTDICKGLEYLPLDHLEMFCCAEKRNKAKVKKIKSTLKLSEEKAESEKKKDNKKKIDAINGYQFYIWWRLTIQNLEITQNYYLQSLKEYLLMMDRITLKISRDDLYLLLASHELKTYANSSSFQDAKDKLRQLEQELIEEHEDLVRGEIERVYQTKIEYVNNRNLFNQRSQEFYHQIEFLTQISNTLRH